MPEKSWDYVESKLINIGLRPNDIKVELIPTFKEWLLKKGLSNLTATAYTTALVCYIKKSSPSYCLKMFSAFRKYKEYLDEAKKVDRTRMLAQLTEELSRQPSIRPPVRLTKYNYIGYIRARILEALYRRGPMSIHQLSIELGMSTSTLREHLLALVAGKYVCDRLVDQENPRLKVYTVCPSCPLRDECDLKSEMKWRGGQQ